MDYKKLRQAKAIETTNRKRLMKINPKLDDGSGIYFLTRTDENEISYFYIGQAVHIIQRMCSPIIIHVLLVLVKSYGGSIMKMTS